MAKQSGGPAFPVTITNEGRTPTSGLNNDEVVGGTAKIYGGMSVLDYFAAKALQGILACPGDYGGSSTIERRVDLAFQYAKAMLAERAK